MIDTKFICTIAALLIGTFAICSVEKKQHVVEGYAGLNQPFTTRSMVDTGAKFPNGNTQFFQTPGRQSLISPRMMNIGLNANIKYNAPSTNNMAADSCQPIILSKMATNDYSSREGFRMPHGRSQIRENYNGGCSNGGCSGLPTCQPGYMSPNGGPMASNYRAGEKNWASAGGPTTTANGCGLSTGDSAISTSGDVEAALPAQTMANLSGAMGDTGAEPVVMNRLMVSLPRKRQQSFADPIRGDLPIVPCPTGWFRPAQGSDPSSSLKPSALAVLGGGSVSADGGATTSTLTNSLIAAGTGGMGVADTMVGAGSAGPQSNAEAALITNLAAGGPMGLGMTSALQGVSDGSSTMGVASTIDTAMTLGGMNAPTSSLTSLGML
jgi:hypothetical protein